MRQSLEAAGFDMAALQGKGEVNFGDKLKPISDEAKAWKTVWSAGQGVGEIMTCPASMNCRPARRGIPQGTGARDTIALATLNQKSGLPIEQARTTSSSDKDACMSDNRFKIVLMEPCSRASKAPRRN
jgi:hypothetical protein